jgi:hypothetical protein
MTYTIEWQDQYGNVDRFDHGYVSIQDAIAFGDFLYKTRKDYRRVSVVDTTTGRVVHDYQH